MQLIHEWVMSVQRDGLDGRSSCSRTLETSLQGSSMVSPQATMQIVCGYLKKAFSVYRIHILLMTSVLRHS